MSRPAQPGSAQPRFLPPIHSVALMQDPAGLTLHLQCDGGTTTRVPLTLAALREIAALAGSALSESATPGRPAEARSGWGMAEAGAGGTSR